MTPFTSAADTEMDRPAPRIGERLWLRTSAAASDSWQEYTLAGYTLTEPDNEPCSLEVEVLDSGLSFDNEGSDANRVKVYGLALFREYIGTESEGRLFGLITGYKVDGPRVTLTCHDWSWLFNFLLAETSQEPTAVEVVADGDYRSLSLLLGGAAGQVYGFEPDGSGTDPAFDEATNTRRRAFQYTAWKLYRDNGEDEIPHPGGRWEVPPKRYNVNHTSGTFSILEDTSGNTYEVTNIRCYLESAATGASPCDMSELLRDVLALDLGDGRSLNAAAGELDIDDTGIDMAGPLTLPLEEGLSASIGDLIKLLQERAASNFRAWYDSSGCEDPDDALTAGDLGTFTWRAVRQEPRGSDQVRTLPEGRLVKTRSAQDVCSGVEVSGYTERNLNLLSTPPAGITVTPTNLQTDGAVHWCTFDGANNPSNVGFAAALPALSNGDLGLGCLVARIPGIAVKDWVPLASWALSDEVRISRVRAIFTGTKNRNPANQYGDFEGFWPGLELLGRRGGGPWAPIFPQVISRPGSTVEVSGSEIVRPIVDEIKWIGRAFLFGVSAFKSPAPALAELEIYVGERYRITLLAQDTDPNGYLEYTNNERHPVTAASSGADTFTIAGDYRGRFHPGASFLAEDSAGAVHDGLYRVESSTLAGSDTVIKVSAVASNSASGHLRIVVSDYRPGLRELLTRPDGNQYHKLYKKDLGDKFNQFLARDVAVQLFDEETRQRDSYTWTGKADPRIRRYQTWQPSGGWRPGQNPPGILVLSKQTLKTPARGESQGSYTTTITGRDYLAGKAGGDV